MKAIVLGATGAVGAKLVELLINDINYTEILVLSRRHLQYKSSKVLVEVINFNEPDQWKSLVKGDVLFSAFGTTIKKAGNQQTQYKIDFNYQYEVAKAAALNGVKKYVLVSASGANDKSKIFYNRMKGELDEAVKQLGFSHVRIIKPSLLQAKRTELRFGEIVGLVLGQMMHVMPLVRRFRPVKVLFVAKAMLSVINSEEPILEIKPWEVFKFAKKYHG